MEFGKAMQYVKRGYKVKRKVWGGFWFLYDNTPVFSNDTKNDDGTYDYFPLNKMILAKQKNNRGYSPALPYPDDMIAEDWEVIDKVR